MGTRGTWTHTEHTETFLGASAPTGEGTRTRTRVRKEMIAQRQINVTLRPPPGRAHGLKLWAVFESGSC
jgi:hypothetical protein